MTLQEQIKNLPSSAGVYHYYDKDNKLLYIGKAKNLANRVKNYFRFSPEFKPNPKNSLRIIKMIESAVFLHYIVVENEHDALILENSLIKQLQPKYNILLRDDKTYPYIYINHNVPFPRFEITRKVILGKGIEYFGPYSIGARDLIDALYELFPLVQKQSCLNGKKACLYYQIKKCLAPCEGFIDSFSYKKIMDKALYALKHKKNIIKLLEERMQVLAQELRFEDASKIRDQINNISKSSIQSGIDLARDINVDIIAIESNEHYIIIIRLFMRDGKIISSTHKTQRKTDYLDENELYKRAILDFYQDNIPLMATQILVAQPFDEQNILSEIISQRIGRKISIVYPLTGDKKKLIELSLKNAKELLRQKQNNIQDIEKTKEAIQELLKLSVLPQKIEIFDNSHLQGEAIVGGMVVYENDQWRKKDYRHYHLDYKDDYYQMKQMLNKRIESFSKNPPPDLWVLDGGVTLVKLAVDLLKSYGTNLDVIGVAKAKIDAKAHRAKGRANDIICDSSREYKLHHSDSRLHFLQNLRDEAHRFAITFHKKIKLKNDKESKLLSIKGIGPVKVKKLLNYFGSFSMIKEASLEELNTILNKKDSLILFTTYKGTKCV